MRKVCINVYQYDELSDAAKEKAREWFSQFVFSDSNDWDHIYEDAATIADMIGINLRQRTVKLMGGGTRMEPQIYFSGFSSQGDGACFDADYSYEAEGIHLVSHAPEDKELHRIAAELAEVQEKYGYNVTATCRHRGGTYYHSHSMEIDVHLEDEDAYMETHAGGVTDTDAETVRQLLRDFADWIYKQLRLEYEYQTSEEAVADNIRANEYEFTADGKRAVG